LFCGLFEQIGRIGSKFLIPNNTLTKEKIKMELINKIKNWFGRTFIFEKVVSIDKDGKLYTLDENDKLMEISAEEEKRDSKTQNTK
jgi:hypothetical protein